MAEPLLKLKDDGSPYTRPPDVEASIDALLGLLRAELVERCRISDSNHPSYVKSECVLHFMRRAKADNNDRHFEALFRILRTRVQRALPAVDRSVEEGESALVQASAIEIRDAVLFRFQELLCQDRAGYDDRLDYFEIRFDGAIANLRRTARRKTWKEENRSQPLSYDDETSELSSEVDPNRPAAPAARAIVVRPGNPSLDRDGVEGDGRARTQGPGREEGLSDAVNKAGVAADTPLPRAPIRKHRRLSDHIVIAFHFACDQGDIEVAGRLLGILERMVLRPPPIGRTERRSDIESLVAALERLWTVRHPAAGEH